MRVDAHEELSGFPHKTPGSLSEKMHNRAMFNAPSAPLNLADLDRSMRRIWLAFAGLALALIVAGLLFAGEYGRSQALETVDAQSRIDANLKASLLRAVLERQRSTPLVLADDVEVKAALSTGDGRALQRLNEKLQALAANTDAAVIYVIGTDGVAVAASNWHEPTSFVGNDYAFREYFRMAMRDGKAEHFAMGTVSKRPGLYKLVIPSEGTASIRTFVEAYETAKSKPEPPKDVPPCPPKEIVVEKGGVCNCSMPGLLGSSGSLGFVALGLGAVTAAWARRRRRP